MRNRAIAYIRVIITISILWQLFKRVDVDLNVLLEGNFWVLLYCFAFTAITALLGAYRWRLILHHHGIRISNVDSIYITLKSLFIAAVVPIPASGDMYRAMCLSKAGSDIAIITKVALADRFSALFWAFIPTVPFFAYTVLEVTQETQGVIILLFGVLLAFLITAVQFSSTVKAFLGQFLGVNAGVHLVSFSISALSITTGFLVLYYLRLNMPPFVGIFAVPTVILAGSLPLTIGGFGLRDLVAVYCSDVMAITSSEAMSFSIIIGLISIVFSLTGAMAFLLPEGVIKK